MDVLRLLLSGYMAILLQQFLSLYNTKLVKGCYVTETAPRTSGTSLCSMLG